MATFQNAYTPAPHLGEPVYWHLGSQEKDQQGDYWGKVWSALNTISPTLLTSYGRPEVLLYGDYDSVHQEKFKDMVRAYLLQALEADEIPSLDSPDTELACARGSAVLARHYGSRHY